MTEGISIKKYKTSLLYFSFSQSNGFAFLDLYSTHFAIDLHNKPKMLPPGWGEWF